MKSLRKIIFIAVAIVDLAFSTGLCMPMTARATTFSDILPQLSQKPPVITQEDIPSLTSPAVVRIVNHVTGSISIPSFSIDWNNLALQLTIGAPITSTVDMQLSGSGFIVNPDGYILTNSHVISTAIVKQTYVYAAIGSYAIAYALKIAATNQGNKNQTVPNQGQITAFLQEAADYLLGRSSATLSSSITVLDPSSTSTNTIAQLIAKGFPANIVSVNDNFLIDGKDVGIIKIDQQNLPALSLGDAVSLSAGQPIYAIGFPASADVDVASFMQSTVTPGSISALKPSDTGDFQLIQTDAKVSEGSSGGPLVDDQGEVIGLTTLISNPTAQTGDIFAFGVPITLAQSVLVQDAISYNATDTYYGHVLNGIALMQNDRCRQAITEFQLAEQGNPSFPVGAYVDPYISQCQGIIAAGQSIDTRFDELATWSKTNAGSLWWIWVIIAAIVIGVIIYVILRLLRTIKKEEGEIGQLESSVGALRTHAPSIPDAVAGGESSAHQTLVDYIKSARKLGKKDEEIVSELGRSGWKANDIAEGFSAATNTPQ